MKLQGQNKHIFDEVTKDLASCFPEIVVLACESSSKIDKKKTILTHDNFEPHQVVHSLLQCEANHFVQKNKNYYQNDLKMAGELLEKPQTYFADPGKILINDFTAKLEILFSNSADKPKLKAQVQKFLGDEQTQNLLESVEVILEEMYMNCILDAPKEAKKRNFPNSEYKNGIVAKIRLYKNSDRLLISCEDPFGSLNVKKFVGRMDEVYKNGAGEVLNFNVREGGAGLGCVLMFEQCSHLFLGVKPQEKTVVSCIIPMGMSNRQRANEKKSLHIIELE